MPTLSSTEERSEVCRVPWLCNLFNSRIRDWPWINPLKKCSSISESSVLSIQLIADCRPLPLCGNKFWNGKKILKRFQDCHENALIQSFEMSPHLICLECGTKTLLWPASGMGLEQAGHKRVWERLLQTIKWGLILKLWLRAFTWQSWNPLRIFCHFKTCCRTVYYKQKE